MAVDWRTYTTAPRSNVAFGSSRSVIARLSLSSHAAIRLCRTRDRHRGYQFERYDLVILAIHDVKAARKAIGNLGLSVVTPTYEHGQVWRVPRSMTDLQIWSRLEKLPCVFSAASLYFRLEVLEEARRERWFDFETLEYSPKRSFRRIDFTWWKASRF